MSSKKNMTALGFACASLILASTIVAQDDLDNLLNDLESEGAPAETAAAETPAATADAEPAADDAATTTETETVADAGETDPEPAADPEPAKEDVAEADEGETTSEEPAPAVAEADEGAAEETSETVADAETTDPEPAKEDVAEADEGEATSEEPTPAVADTEKNDEPAPAVAETDDAKTDGAAETVATTDTKDPEPAKTDVAAAETPEPAKPAATIDDLIVVKDDAATTPAPQPEPAKATAVAEKTTPAEPPHPDAELLSDIVATETLNRETMQRQIHKEIGEARAAMQMRDWETAYRKYELARRHLRTRGDLVELRRECDSGMANARYQEAKQSLREGNRARALELAEDAMALRHPNAGAMVDALKSESAADAETDIADIRHRRNDQDYKMDRNEIRGHLRRSAQLMAVADYDQAIEECDLVIRYNPYNKEAIALRKRIQRKREMTLENEREATRRGMIADVGAAWRPVYAVNSSKLKASDGGTMKTAIGGGGEMSVEQSIEKRMKEMMLPSISFRQPATIFDAVEFFIQASKDYDRPDLPIEQRGFNFVLYPPSGGVQVQQDAGGGNDNAFAAAATEESATTGAGGYPVLSSISATNVSLWEALSLVCKLSEFKFIIQGSVVQVMHKNQTTEEMITRSYTIVEDFLERMNDASSGLKSERAGEFGGGGGDDGGGSSNDEAAWQQYFKEMGVDWPDRSRIKYIKAIGKLRVTNTADQLAIFEQALNELNVTPRLVEIETRFVEVAQEDLNSLGFEWLLNSDYSFNVGGKLAKALRLRNGEFPLGGTATELVATGTQAPVQKLPDGQYVMQQVYSEQVRDARWTKRAGSSKNIGLNAMGGNSSNYGTGLRYLSTQGNHISGEGMSNNDQFMRVNAFLGNADLSMILHMLSQRSDTDLLSAPKIVTKSGNEATIKVVTIYRYPQDYDVTIQSTGGSGGSGNNNGYSSGSSGKILPMVEPQNFETQEVGVILTVTPEVTAEGQMINLQLNPKVISEPTWHNYGMRIPKSAVMGDSSLLAGVSVENLADTSLTAIMNLLKEQEEKQSTEWFDVPMEQPFFQERSIDTKISIYNGATVVMGGLITEERKSMEDKIPFLGDIPFIGRLFRSRSEWSNKRNLLIFVTARLVDPRGRQIQFNAGDEDQKEGDAAATPAPADGK